MDITPISVILIAIMIGLGYWRYRRREAWYQRRAQGEKPKIRPTTPAADPIFQANYDYRMVVGDQRNADGRWNEIVIHDYDHRAGDWSRNGKRIKNMSQEELDGYFHSLTVNKWEAVDPPKSETVRRRYFRRPRYG